MRPKVLNDQFEFKGGLNTPAASSRPYLFIILIALLPALACGVINPQYQLNNQVRRAVFEYEKETRGLAKDLVIHFRRDEPRVKFEGQHQNGGHSVWLYPAGAEEYFASRPQQASYLYIQEIQYYENQSSATVNVYRGDGAGYQGWQLTLTRDTSGRWVVTEEVKIEENSLR
jgi:hypothetical protein